jgi:hypothetical protein
VILASLLVLVLLVACFGYFLLPSIIENRASALIEENAGVPVRVEIDVPFSFIFTGKINKARIYAPLIQASDGLNIRHLEIETHPFQLSPLSIFGRDFRGLRDVAANGTFIITVDDINSYLERKGQQLEVSIVDNEIFVTTYLSAIGKIKVRGRLVPNSSGASFQAENVVEPRTPSLIFFPQLWSNISFNFSVEPLDRAFKIEKYFVDKQFIKVYFSLDREFLREISDEIISD